MALRPFLNFGVLSLAGHPSWRAPYDHIWLSGYRFNADNLQIQARTLKHLTRRLPVVFAMSSCYIVIKFVISYVVLAAFRLCA